MNANNGWPENRYSPVIYNIYGVTREKRYSCIQLYIYKMSPRGAHQESAANAIFSIFLSSIFLLMQVGFPGFQQLDFSFVHAPIGIFQKYKYVYLSKIGINIYFLNRIQWYNLYYAL